MAFRIITALRICRPYSIYAIMCLLVMLPLLLPGYILTLDMVFTPSIQLPGHVSSSYLFYALLHAANYVIPSMVLQKILLITILLGSMVGIHRLIVRLENHESTTMWHIYAASMLYALNPYTYSRFMAGQFAVLLGYMLLPWLLLTALRAWKQPRTITSIKLGLLITIIGIASIHTLGLAALLGVAALASTLIYPSRDKALLQRSKHIGIALATFFLTSCYWLIPLMAGRGSTAKAVAAFSERDTATFATTGSNVFEQVIHILQLRGFWAEGRNLFLLPHDVFPLWGLAVIALWGLVLYGLVNIWRSNKPLAVFVSIATTAAVMLALGIPIEQLATYLPFIAGYREPHKFVGIVALCFSICLAKGVSSMLTRFEKRGMALYGASGIAVLILPLLLAPTMLWGFNGQLQPRQYPDDWYAMNKKLTADTDHFSVVFLPWHQYMSYRFAGRIIANPAPAFFDKPVIVSQDPELGGAVAINSQAQTKQVSTILRTAGGQTNLGSQLDAYNCKYILLAKDLDYRDYRYLDQQHDLMLIEETKNLKLYRNEAWRQQ